MTARKSARERRQELFASFGARYGELVDRYRGIVPRTLLVVQMALESRGDPFAVSKDPVLIEVGLSQAPLARAWRMDVDPFDVEGGIWLGCVEANAAAERYREFVPGISAADTWYLMLLSYSAGRKAVEHILRTTQSWVERRRARGITSSGLLADIPAWAKVTDLALPQHARHWGRQSPEIIGVRIRRQVTRLSWARALGPIDGPDYIPEPPPPATRPSALPAFPTDLVPAARIAANPRATSEQHAKAHAEVKGYARRRRRGA
ncbi:MAG: hypothetical protein JXB32_20225 [Deltaproteobacteria bacterium]|nr:hypothetical protein [Deltaproteobacteria bacterium]